MKGTMDAYETLGILGEGTYGVVMKARHRASGKLVAIKRFKQTDEDEHVRKTSTREVRMLQQLRHPNVVRLEEVFRKDGKLFLVFEYIDRTILQVLEATSRGIPPQDLRSYIYQLLRGVEFCHAHNVIHRDVKPENVLIDESGMLKLCDFGFARQMTTKGKYTDYVATRWYRAPELLVGDVSYGKPVDVWAIGCMFAELSDGQPLFPGESDLDQLCLILQTCGPVPDRMVHIFEHNSLYRNVSFPQTGIVYTLQERYHRQPEDWMELLYACLHPDPAKRLTCTELMMLPFFTRDGFRDRYEAELRTLSGLPMLKPSPAAAAPAGATRRTNAGKLGGASKAGVASKVLAHRKTSLPSNSGLSFDGAGADTVKGVPAPPPANTPSSSNRVTDYDGGRDNVMSSAKAKGKDGVLSLLSSLAPAPPTALAPSAVQLPMLFGQNTERQPTLSNSPARSGSQSRGPASGQAGARTSISRSSTNTVVAAAPAAASPRRAPAAAAADSGVAGGGAAMSKRESLSRTWSTGHHSNKDSLPTTLTSSPTKWNEPPQVSNATYPDPQRRASYTDQLEGGGGSPAKSTSDAGANGPPPRPAVFTTVEETGTGGVGITHAGLSTLLNGRSGVAGGSTRELSYCSTSRRSLVRPSHSITSRRSSSMRSLKSHHLHPEHNSELREKVWKINSSSSSGENLPFGPEVDGKLDFLHTVKSPPLPSSDKEVSPVQITTHAPVKAEAIANKDVKRETGQTAPPPKKAAEPAEPATAAPPPPVAVPSSSTSAASVPKKAASTASLASRLPDLPSSEFPPPKAAKDTEPADAKKTTTTMTTTASTAVNTTKHRPPQPAPTTFTTSAVAAPPLVTPRSSSQASLDSSVLQSRNHNPLVAPPSRDRAPAKARRGGGTHGTASKASRGRLPEGNAMTTVTIAAAAPNTSRRVSKPRRDVAPPAQSGRRDSDATSTTHNIQQDRLLESLRAHGHAQLASSLEGMSASISVSASKLSAARSVSNLREGGPTAIGLSTHDHARATPPSQLGSPSPMSLVATESRSPANREGRRSKPLRGKTKKATPPAMPGKGSSHATAALLALTSLRTGPSSNNQGGVHASSDGRQPGVHHAVPASKTLAALMSGTPPALKPRQSPRDAPLQQGRKGNASYRTGRPLGVYTLHTQHTQKVSVEGVMEFAPRRHGGAPAASSRVTESTGKPCPSLPPMALHESPSRNGGGGAAQSSMSRGTKAVSQREGCATGPSPSPTGTSQHGGLEMLDGARSHRGGVLLPLTHNTTGATPTRT